MVINSTNIRKTLKAKRPRHVTLEIQVLGWDRHKNVAGKYSPLDNWVSNGNEFTCMLVFHIIAIVILFMFFSYLELDFKTTSTLFVDIITMDSPIVLILL